MVANVIRDAQVHPLTREMVEPYLSAPGADAVRLGDLDPWSYVDRPLRRVSATRKGSEATTEAA